MKFAFKHLLYFALHLVTLSASWSTACSRTVFDPFLGMDVTEISEQAVFKGPKKVKDWLFIVFLAADNDLRGFAARNIKQMATEGSRGGNVYIFVDLHIRISGNKKITRRYLIEDGNIIHINADDPDTQRMDSGDHQTLISCCAWAIENYQARHHALVLWNHGTGIIDPINGRIVHATELFSFNPAINKLELDRNIGFFDFISAQEKQQRGICWDDSSGNYLTNQKLVSALEHICFQCLDGKKFDILGFDACLMAMTEVADLVKDYAHFMVSSQEVELGTGWNYQLVLAPFAQRTLTPSDFSKHIVAMYEKTYNKVTNDYTLSSVQLSKINKLNANIDLVARLLAEGLRNQQNNSVKTAIKTSRDRNRCTHFDEPSYIDLHHFYSNLQQAIDKVQLANDTSDNWRKKLQQALSEGQAIIQNIVVANAASKNLAKAKGLSIYFPERNVHFSYQKTPFAQATEWATFLHRYINT